MGPLKSTLLLGFIRLLFITGLILLYLNRVNISPEILVIIDSSEVVNVSAESPLGGSLNLNKHTSGSCYNLNNRYGRNIFISGDTSKIKISLVYRNEAIVLDSKALAVQGYDMYMIMPTYYPKYSLANKLKDIKNVNFSDMLYPRIIDILFAGLKIIGISMLAFLSLILLRKIIKKRKLIISRTGIILTGIYYFIRSNYLRFFIPILLSLIPGILYGIADSNVLQFLNLSHLQFMLVVAVILFPVIFCFFFSNKLKLNRLFWLSILTIVVVNAFVFFPQIYLYGIGFKEDVKFYIKLFNYQSIFESLFTPSSGYLSLIQGIIPWFTANILGFRNYLPESLQITSLLLSSFMFASFNLKIFRNIIENDTLRFGISLAVGIFKIAIPELWFIYDGLFFAAVLLWLLLFCIDKMSWNGYAAFVIAFVCLILSKPIFFIFIPAFVFLFIIGVAMHNKRYLIASVIMLICIGIQMILYNEEPVIGGQSATFNSPGTNYISEFSENGISWIRSITYGFYIFIRIPVSIFLTETKSGILQIVLNSVSFIFIAGINGYLLYRLIKFKELSALILLFGSFLSVSSAILFVKVVADNFLIFNNQVIREMSFIELINSGYIVPYQRYLILGFIPFIALLAYFLFLITKKFNGIMRTLGLSLLLLIIIGGRVERHFSNMQQLKAANPVLFIKPSQSIWRQYNSIITKYPKGFYIPYYGYPVQTECIRNGIDRITDINTNKDGHFLIESENNDYKKWQTIEIITEANEAVYHSIIVQCITLNNDTIIATPVNTPVPNDRFIIFRLDDYYTLKEIIFVNENGITQHHNKPVRLVGLF